MMAEVTSVLGVGIAVALDHKDEDCAVSCVNTCCCSICPSSNRIEIENNNMEDMDNMDKL